MVLVVPVKEMLERTCAVGKRNCAVPAVRLPRAVPLRRRDPAEVIPVTNGEFESVELGALICMPTTKPAAPEPAAPVPEAERAVTREYPAALDNHP